MKFITPVSMKVTKEQFKTLESELYKLGYKLSRDSNNRYNIIVSNMNGESDYFGLTFEDYRNNHGRYYIDHYNPDLFLALAACTDVPDGITGEYWMCIKRTAGHGVGTIVKACSPWPHYYNGHWRKATKEEIIAHFTKEKEKPISLDKVQVGDWIECINCNDRSKDLTRGGIYKVIKLGDCDTVKIYNNNIIPEFYSLSRFKPYVAKEEFVLPEKWVIKITPENKTIIHNWAIGHHKRENDYHFGTDYSYIWCNHGFIGVDYQRRSGIGYDEITYEQFLQHVLKQPSMEKKFKVGGKARFVSGNLLDFTLGKEYQVYYINQHGLLNLVDDCGRAADRMPQHFEPVEERRIVGWKMRDVQLQKAAAAIVETNRVGSDFLNYLAQAGDAGWAQLFRKAGVLDLWFEPIFSEEEKPREVVLTLDADRRVVTVTPTKITVDENGVRREVAIGDLKQLLHYIFELNRYNKVAGHPVSVETVKIGCSRFPVDDIRTVIDTYNRLNGN